MAGAVTTRQNAQQQTRTASAPARAQTKTAVQRMHQGFGNRAMLGAAPQLNETINPEWESAPNSVRASHLQAAAGMPVQRKCACGGGCPWCQSKPLSKKLIQPKLTISTPGDQYEQEADQVAEQVMRMNDPGKETNRSNVPTAPLVQRKANASDSGVGTAPPIVHDVLASPGKPLDAAARAFFEPRFGHDFSQVRVHTDMKAAESARSINALAYTIGRDVILGGGFYTPGPAQGNRLLAHELTHVIQQRIGGPVIQRAEVDDIPAFCYSPDGSQALRDVGGVLNTWIAEAQIYGQQANLDVPIAIYEDLATLADPLTTIVEERIANLSRDEVRHISVEDSRYQIRPEVISFYRLRGKTPLAPVIHLCGVCVGSDKVGHFFQQGGEYFGIGEALRERLQSWTLEERIAFLDRLEPEVFHSALMSEDQIIELYTNEYGKWLEGFPNQLSEEEVAWIRSNNLIPEEYFKGIYGRWSSGVLSRADLEANLQGGRFYRNAMQNPGARLDICQYVNDNWNEYSNPSSYAGTRFVQTHFRSRIAGCGCR